MKRWTRGAMFDHLRDARALTATSRQMGHGAEWLGRVLRHDPDGVLSRGEAQAILDAHEAASGGVPTA